MNTKPIYFVTTALWVAFTAINSAFAHEQVNSKKDQYTLFNPTPRELMRSFSTDRPDKTESPMTVDAGHYQLETDLVIYSYDKQLDGTEVKSASFNSINLKAGLLNDVDLQVIVENYAIIHVKDPEGQKVKRHGFGDITYRLKYNLYGNDSGPSSFGLMGFVKTPTSSGGIGNKKHEGGLMGLLGLNLPREMYLGLMLQYSKVANELSDGYHGELVSSAALSRTLIGHLAGYIEIYSESSNEVGAAWVATLDGGFTYALTSDMQLDLGVNLGLTEVAEDLNPFLGLSMRF